MDTREVRTVYRWDADSRVGETQWSIDDRTIYFNRFDSAGHAQIWAVPAAGGEARSLVRFDHPRLASTRNDLAGDGRAFYFTLVNRQSDLWIAAMTSR